jgi:hypothetical protein
VERGLVPVEGVGIEAQADWDHLRTPETYLGFERGSSFASADDAVLGRPRSYQPPGYLGFNEWTLTGEWTLERDKAVLEEPGGSIACRFEARDAHLILSLETQEAIPFRVLLDGEAPGASHGVDVDEEGNGLLRDGRLYQLVREQGRVRDRIVEITFLEPGARAYSFTFG